MDKEEFKSTMSVSGNNIVSSILNTNNPQSETTSQSKKSSENNDKHITVRVCSQKGDEIYFKIKPNTPMRKLMDSYCGRSALSYESLRFLYDGMRVQPESTAKSLGMQDEDIIDVVLQQTGGDHY